MSIRDWIERIFLAITFAEANDEKTARKLLKRKRKAPRKRNRPRPRLRK